LKSGGGQAWYFRNRIPSPKGIYDNTAWGVKINGYKDDMDTLVEHDRTQSLFTNPKNELTEQYITGRFG